MNPADEALFFENPAFYRPPPGDFGILYLLRRDINQSLEHKILWLGAMGIMTGIDLLAKFWAGKDNSSGGGVSKRFDPFVGRYFDCPVSDKPLIYDLRNSLLHSFGLHAVDPKGNIKYCFQLQATPLKPLIEPGDAGKYRIDVIALHKHFETAVEKYRSDLHHDPVLQNSFGKMFPKYGSIPIT